MSTSPAVCDVDGLRVVVIADASPVTDWLLPRLHAVVPIREVIRPDWSDTTLATPSTRRSPLLVRLRRRLRTRWYRALDAQHADRLQRALLAHGPVLSLDVPIHTVSFRRINDDDVRARIAAHAPDLVLVCGAPILAPALCAVAARGTWNVHLGYAPTWRGLHTLRVPWQRADWAHLGITVHHAAPQVDAGAPVLRLRAALEPDDSFYTMKARLVAALATELEARLRREAARPRERGPRTDVSAAAAGPDRTAGTLVRFHDRRIRDALAERLRDARGGARPRQDLRVEHFDDDGT